MSNRRGRGRGSTAYSMRAQRAAVRTPRRPVRRPSAPDPAPGPRRRRSVAWLAVGLAVLVELGHLGTAYVEWPTSAARGGYHVLAGALLGLVAAVVLPDQAGGGPGATPGGSRVARAGAAAGAVLAVAGPVLWLAGGLLGAPPYAELPVLAAAGLAGAELVLAALLVGVWWVARVPPDAADGA